MILLYPEYLVIFNVFNDFSFCGVGAGGGAVGVGGGIGIPALETSLQELISILIFFWNNAAKNLKS